MGREKLCGFPSGSGGRQRRHSEIRLYPLSELGGFAYSPHRDPRSQCAAVTRNLFYCLSTSFLAATNLTDTRRRGQSRGNQTKTAKPLATKRHEKGWKRRRKSPARLWALRTFASSPWIFCAFLWPPAPSPLVAASAVGWMRASRRLGPAHGLPNQTVTSRI